MWLQIQLRLQKPTVVAEVGFMLAVTKFFVPGFTMSGNTPTPFESNDIVLEGELATSADLSCQQLWFTFETALNHAPSFMHEGTVLSPVVISCAS